MKTLKRVVIGSNFYIKYAVFTQFLLLILLFVYQKMRLVYHVYQFLLT